MILRSVNYPVFLLTVVFGLVGSIALFPMSWTQWRPEWVGLLVFYWVLRAPHRFGIVTAWGLGLLVDVLQANVLGVNAMAFSLVAFLVLSAHQRLQMYPLPQQCLMVFLFIGLAQMLMHFVQQMLGTSQGGFHYLFPAVTSALIWPVFMVFLDGMNRKLG